MALVEQSSHLVAEVKTALYEADHSQGAEVMLDEVGNMLETTAIPALKEAEKLQHAAERWIGHRKKIALRLQANHAALNGFFRRRSDYAREQNVKKRQECDRLWSQIREWEVELDHQPRIKSRGPLLDSRTPDTPAAVSAQNGLTLEGAHSLLRAFATVLRPHVDSLASKHPGQWTPEEAVALDFLNACKDSSGKVPGMGTLAPSNPTLGVSNGEPVESLKSGGVVPMPVISLDEQSHGNGNPLLSPGAFVEETQTLLDQLRPVMMQ
jgi:hypothetical protein